MFFANNEDATAFKGYTSDEIVQHWILNIPMTSDTFPDPPKNNNQFLGSHYGSGRWKYRDVGTNNWKDYEEYVNAVLEFNYRRGIRRFKLNDSK